MDGNGVGTDAALTLPGTLRRTATVGSLTNPDAGVVTGRERAPWGRILTAAEALAARLAGLGVPDRARVGLLTGPDDVAGVEMLFACGLLGAACVPVPTGPGTAPVADVLVDAGVDTLVLTSPDPGCAVPDPGRVPGLRRAVAVGVDRTGFTRVDDEPGPPAPYRFAAPQDVALVVYPSGEAARPRGCALTHGALVAAGRALGRDRLGLGAEDVLWAGLPPSHLGFVGPLLAILDAGGTVVTGGPLGRDVTVAAPCFPALTAPLLDDGVPRGLRLLLTSGPPQTVRAVQERAGRAVVVTCWGRRETGGVAATTRPGDPDDVRLGTNGHPLPGVELAVADPDTGGPLPSGEPGEILARGPADPASWIRTGDLGLLDADGRLHHRGRLADAVTVGGESVAAHEIESVLLGHPGVRAAAVVAAPDPRFDEVPAAFVELHPGATVTGEELTEHCAAALARFKVPRHVRFVTRWPMSTTTVRKGPLRERIAEETREDA